MNSFKNKIVACVIVTPFTFFWVNSNILAATISGNIENSTGVNILNGNINIDSKNNINGILSVDNSAAVPLILKLFLWSGKNTPLGGIQNENSLMPSMLELSNNNLSGSMFSGGELFATFEQNSTNFNAVFFESNQSYPELNSNSSMFIIENYKTSTAGSVIGEGHFSIDDYVEDYRVEYNLNGDLDALLPMNYSRSLTANLNYNNSIITVNGVTRKVPEPSTVLGLVTALGFGGRLFQQKKYKKN